MHRSPLLQRKTLGTRCEGRCRQAQPCADQHGLRRAEGRQPGSAAQQVHRDPRRQAPKEGRCPAPGVQGVQVRHRRHHHRRQRHRHHSQGVRESRLPDSPRQQATARDGCGIQGRAGEAPPRGGHRPGDRPSRPESNQRRGSRPPDETRPALCHRAPRRRLGRAPSGDHLSPSRHRQGQRSRRRPGQVACVLSSQGRREHPRPRIGGNHHSANGAQLQRIRAKPCAKPPSSTRWTWPRSRPRSSRSSPRRRKRKPPGRRRTKRSQRSRAQQRRRPRPRSVNQKH